MLFAMQTVINCYCPYLYWVCIHISLLYLQFCCLVKAFYSIIRYCSLKRDKLKTQIQIWESDTAAVYWNLSPGTKYPVWHHKCAWMSEKTWRLCQPARSWWTWRCGRFLPPSGPGWRTGRASCRPARTLTGGGWVTWGVGGDRISSGCCYNLDTNIWVNLAEIHCLFALSRKRWGQKTQLLLINFYH